MTHKFIIDSNTSKCVDYARGSTSDAFDNNLNVMHFFIDDFIFVNNKSVLISEAIQMTGVSLLSKAALCVCCKFVVPCLQECELNVNVN